MEELFLKRPELLSTSDCFHQAKNKRLLDGTIQTLDLKKQHFIIEFIKSVLRCHIPLLIDYSLFVETGDQKRQGGRGWKEIVLKVICNVFAKLCSGVASASAPSLNKQYQ